MARPSLFIKWMKRRPLNIIKHVNRSICAKDLSKFNANKSNYYDVLDVTKEASKKDIRIAYLQKTKEFHPDKNPEDDSMHDKFVQVTEAYEVLSDIEKRLLYDAMVTGSHNSNAYQQHHQRRYASSDQSNPFGSYEEYKWDGDLEQRRRMYEEFYNKTYPEYQEELAKDFAKRRGKNKKIVIFVTLFALILAFFNYSRIMAHHVEYQKRMEDMTARNAAYLQDGKTGYRSYLKRMSHTTKKEN